MTSYVALLRGINVGGHKQVAMADLRDLLTKLGLAEPQSLLQSGNLVFRCRGRTCLQLELLLEAETNKRLDIRTEFFVRTADEWRAIVARNPFGNEAERDPSRLLVMCLKDAPSATSVKALQALLSGPEIARVDGRHAYIVYPSGIGRSRLTGTLVEKKLVTRGTGRNWNTVLKLDALARMHAT